MICVPILARTSPEALTKLAKAETLADMTELRLDFMDDFDLEAIISASSKPLLVTYRSEQQGGKGVTDTATCVRYLKTAIEFGADLVDVEYRLPLEFRQELFLNHGKSNLVVSAHLVHETPSRKELEELFQGMAATGADIVKIVTYATCWEDNLRVLELIPKARAEGIKIIALCMGPMGQMSRIFSCLMGGYATFASLDPGQESAPGQIPVRKMKELLEMLSI